MSSEIEQEAAQRSRRRLTREARYEQLLDVARQIARKEGTEALTLGRLAERAEVAKPVVYGHFPTRSALLTALYLDFDARQTAIIDAALQASKAEIHDRADVIASSYVDCVLSQGREIPGVIAALASSPELEKLKREYQLVFMEKCRLVLAPFAKSGTIRSAGLWAMLGAAEALSHAAATGEITASQAKIELFDTIIDMVHRNT